MAKPLTEKQKLAILADIKSGKPTRDVMRTHGVSAATCSRIATAAGITRSRGLPGFQVDPGRRFGHLTVLLPDVRVEGSNHRHAKVSCDCGQTVELPLYRLKRGAHCCGRGCPFFYSAEERQRRADQVRALNSRPGSREARVRNLNTGQKTDRWRSLVSAQMKAYWQDPAWRAGQIVHGMYQHPLYQTWAGMMARCYNEKNTAYKYYGANGVSVHETWHDPRVFIADVEAEIGPRPDDGRRMSNGRTWFSLDRINVFGNYGPGNIRWADPKTQRANQRKSA